MAIKKHYKLGYKPNQPHTMSLRHNHCDYKLLFSVFGLQDNLDYKLHNWYYSYRQVEVVPKLDKMQQQANHNKGYKYHHRHWYYQD